MFQLLKISMQGLALGVGIFLAGCQSSAPPTAATHMMSTQAVQCDMCKTTIVNAPSTVSSGGHGGWITVYSPHKEMDCPDCKSAASNFFATGKLEHTCKACGGNMVPCEGH
jgi:hypothetical protein